MKGSDNRREERFLIDSVNLPFLGTREEDHLPFGYLLMDISLHGARIAIPPWLVCREKLVVNDLVNFHVPFRLQQEVFDQGRVVWTGYDPQIESHLYGVRMEKSVPAHQPVFISLEKQSIALDLKDFASAENLLSRIIKDAALLKKGVLIYLSHLVPFFSRITGYPREDYLRLKEFLLDDIRRSVRQNQERLEHLHRQVTEARDFQAHMARHIDLEELRGIMESELYLDLFRLTFGVDSILPYLNAIKELEKRLYASYNTIVMLYVQSL